MPGRRARRRADRTPRLDHQRKVLDLLETLQHEHGLTLVVVTHDPNVAARADRILRMVDGRIVGEAQPARGAGARAGG